MTARIRVPAVLVVTMASFGLATMATADQAAPFEEVNIRLEQDELNVKIKAQLPEASRAFSVRDKMLVPGVEYVLSIATVSSVSNISVSETTFKTSE